MSEKHTENHTLNDKQRKAVESYLSGMNRNQVAAAVSVTPETISRWKALPDFQALLRSRRSEIWRDQRERLRDMLALCLDGVHEALQDRNDKRSFQWACGVVLKAIGLAVDSPDLPDDETQEDTDARFMESIKDIPEERMHEFMNAHNKMRRDFPEFDY